MPYFHAIVVLTAIFFAACSRQQQTTAVEASPTYSERGGGNVAISKPAASEQESAAEPVAPRAPSPTVIVKPAPTANSATSDTAVLSDDAIRTAIIQQSLASYSGSCPCPYSTARGGTKCGGRSAYSRPGGESPLCFPPDVSDELISAYRAKATRL
jgi:hypothetical protein